MTNDADSTRGDRVPEHTPVKHCEKAHGQNDRQNDREEFQAALAALDAARAMTTRMADAEDRPASAVLAERRALADLLVARHRMDEFKPRELAGD
jgi:hypothetical protein